MIVCCSKWCTRIRHLLIEIAAWKHWPYLTCQAHTLKPFFFILLFYILCDSIYCLLSSLVQAHNICICLSCLFIFALKHARHVRQNVTSQCTHAMHFSIYTLGRFVAGSSCFGCFVFMCVCERERVRHSESNVISKWIANHVVHTNIRAKR